MLCTSQQLANKLILSNRNIVQCVVISAELFKTLVAFPEVSERCTKSGLLEGHKLVSCPFILEADPKVCSHIKICTCNFSTSSKVDTGRKLDTKKNYYHILGVTPSCSDTKIKQAYYRLSKVYHPDVNKSEAATAKFHEISEAYEVLSNPALKHQYDGHHGGHSHRHGVHRGVPSHPVNFNARGPFQHRKTDKYNYDAWMKEHYSAAFKRTIEDKKNLENLHRERGENVQREMKIDLAPNKKSRPKTEENNATARNVALALCAIATFIYTIVKWKKF